MLHPRSTLGLQSPCALRGAFGWVHPCVHVRADEAEALGVLLPDDEAPLPLRCHLSPKTADPISCLSPAAPIRLPITLSHPFLRRLPR